MAKSITGENNGLGNISREQKQILTNGRTFPAPRWGGLAAHVWLDFWLTPSGLYWGLTPQALPGHNRMSPCLSACFCLFVCLFCFVFRSQDEEYLQLSSLIFLPTWGKWTDHGILAEDCQSSPAQTTSMHLQWNKWVYCWLTDLRDNAHYGESGAIWVRGFWKRFIVVFGFVLCNFERRFQKVGFCSELDSLGK